MEWHSFGSKCVLLSVYHLKSDKNYDSYWNQKSIVGEHQNLATFTKLNLLMTHDQDAVCVSGTEPRYVVPK